MSHVERSVEPSYRLPRVNKRAKRGVKGLEARWHAEDRIRGVVYHGTRPTAAQRKERTERRQAILMAAMIAGVALFYGWLYLVR